MTHERDQQDEYATRNGIIALAVIFFYILVAVWMVAILDVSLWILLAFSAVYLAFAVCIKRFISKY